MKKKALGKGLDALIPRVSDVMLEEAGARVVDVDIEQIAPNPYQPRRAFNEQALAEMAQSIKERGVLQPLLVRNLGDKYQLIVGERRLRAARMAGIDKIPVIITQAEDEDALQMTLIENLQRENLNPIEEAQAYKTLQESFALSQEEISRRVGKERPTVANALRLLNLPKEVQAEIQAGRLSAGHGRALLMLENAKQQIELAQLIVQRGLSVREAEEKVKQTVALKPGKVELPRLSPALREIEERLFEELGLKVKISPRGKRGGRIEIYFNSIAQAEALIKRLQRNK